MNRVLICWLLALLPVVLACAVPPLDAPGDDDDDDGPPPVAGDDFETCIPDVDDGPIFKETLTLAGADGTTLVRIARRPGEGPTIGETFAFELLGFALQEAGALSVCVVDPASLSYVYEHHNWDDQAVAEAGARTLTLAMSYDVVTSTWTDVLGDSSSDEDLALETADCVSDGPSPANGCFQRN